MFPMTPMTSWSVLLLLLAIVALLAWGLLGTDAAPNADDQDIDPGDADGEDITAFADIVTAAVSTPRRPRLRLIRGGLDDRGTTRREPRLYDWARDGL